MRRAQGIRVLAAIAACAAPLVATADDATPDWLRRQPRSIADLEIQPPDEYLVVLQRDRPDGAELLTLRVPLATFDSVLAYAGAGVNRTTYLDQPDPLVADSGGRHRSIADLEIQPPDEYLVVLQRDRPDGAELLTLRVPLATFDTVLAYAGAGVNRTTYFDQPDLLVADSGGRHRSIGAAAELGAEWRVGENLAMSADLRWIDLASNADFIRNDDSLVAADSVALGFSLGWRFR